MLLNKVTEHHLYTHHTQNLENILFIKSIFFLHQLIITISLLFKILQIVVLEIDKSGVLSWVFFKSQFS